MNLYLAKHKNKKLSVFIRSNSDHCAKLLLFEYCEHNIRPGLRLDDYKIVYDRKIIFESNNIQGVYSLTKHNQQIYRFDEDKVINTIDDFEIIKSPKKFFN